MTPNPTPGLVASRRGVRVDTETGWSAVAATDAEDCDRLAASFTAMAAHLRAHPEIVAAWDQQPELDTGDARHDDVPEARVRGDEREQLAEAGRLLPLNSSGGHATPGTPAILARPWQWIRNDEIGGDAITADGLGPADGGLMVVELARDETIARHIADLHNRHLADTTERGRGPLSAPTSAERGTVVPESTPELAQTRLDGPPLCGRPGEYWPTGSIRIDLNPCDLPAGHDGRHHWPPPANLPAHLPPPTEPAIGAQPRGCPEPRWDGPYQFRCGLGAEVGVCAVHGPFRDRETS